MPKAQSPVEDLRRAAADVFGYPSLRDGQLPAMVDVARGRDVLVVAPTGSGKSAIWQVPATLRGGLTVVVSPLLALQRDQVAALDSARIAAAAVNSAESAGAVEEAFAAARRGDLEVLYVAPEQLAKDEVVEALAAARPRLVAVDEAHCVSVWGADFRPDYLRLREAVERLGRPPVVALTATAAPPVREDIVELLGLRDPGLHVGGFDRPNLWLEVTRAVTAAEQRAALVERAVAEEPPGLVYAATRRDVEELTDELRGVGVDAHAYHAGLPAAEKRAAHEAFTASSTAVVVATSAFGMGIDKPDVRFVLHAAVAESLDAYYQQIGRAGRDGEPAYAILYYRPEDLRLPRFFAGGTVDVELAAQVGAALRRRRKPVRPAALAAALDLTRARVTRTVNLFEQVGAVVASADGLRWVAGTTVDDAVRRAEEAAERRRRVERTRVEMLRGYAETLGCRRQFLLGYFGEEYPEPCGYCDTCATGTAEEQPDGDTGFPVQSRVRHPEWGDGVVMHEEGDRLTVLFDEAGYRTLSLDAVRANDLLALADR